MVAENFDSISIIESTRNELIVLSDYAAVMIMRLDEMVYQSGIVDKDTATISMDLHRKQLRDAVFWAFKEGIIIYYKEKGMP